jgi:transposase InsO family protein
VIRDRDQVYGTLVTRQLRAMGIRDKPIAPGSPWQNGFAERLIGSIRRECVDHVIVFGEAHLRQILMKYAAYYNELRTHRSLDKTLRSIAPSSTVVELPKSRPNGLRMTLTFRFFNPRLFLTLAASEPRV